jgi:glycosyltransferase involved in cell wall biosynthesis
MRVLLVNKHAYLMGGVDSHCVWLSDGLRQRGHEVMWLSTEAGANIERSGAFVPRRGGARGAVQTLFNRTAAAAARVAIADFAPDVVHAHLVYPHLSVAPLAVARRAGVPVLQTLHTYELLSAHYASDAGGWIDLESHLWTDRVRNTATFPVRRIVHRRLVDEYLSVSQFVADAHARYGVPSLVVPNAVAAGSGPLPPYAERRGILFVGRLVVEKGVLEALELARALPELPVTIAGGGPLYPLVRRTAQELPNLTALGWVNAPDLPEHLRAARLLVMPSRCAETSGLAALEALAWGTPVVALPRGGLTELVAQTGAGVLAAAPGEELAAACATLHDDRVAWERLSARGREAVAGQFSLNVWLDRVVAVYRQLAARGSGSTGPRGRRLSDR